MGRADGRPPPAAARRIRRRQLAFAAVYLAIGAFLLYGARPRIVVARAPRAVPPAAGLAGEVARIVGAEGRRVGLMVGVVRPGERAILPFGARSLADGRPPVGGTVFPIGSITKTFTGILLAEMAARGEVALEDPVARHLPPGAVPAGWEGSGITLLELATHTSGLPRMPPWMGPTAGKLLTWRLLRDRYRGHTRGELFARLGDVALAAPGAFAYSNLGVGLLGHALENAAGVGYGDLVRRRIAGPLGMSSARVGLTPDLAPRLATGFYDAWRLGPIGVELPASPWEYPVLQGAGALLSTGDDLLRFLGANVDPPATPLGDAIRRSRLRRRERDGEGGGVGLGWHLTPWPETGDELVWHSGATSAYTSFLGFLPGRRVGVFVLNNTPEPVDDLAREILRLLACRAPRPLDG